MHLVLSKVGTYFFDKFLEQSQNIGCRGGGGSNCIRCILISLLFGEWDKYGLDIHSYCGVAKMWILQTHQRDLWV